MSKIEGFDHNDLDFPYWDDKADELLNEDVSDDGFDEFVQREKTKKAMREFLDELEEEDD